MPSLSVVQSASNGNTAAAIAQQKFTFGSAPTSGNLMVAVAFFSAEGGTNPNAATGWTCPTFTLSSDSTFYIALFYRYAGASEPTLQPIEVIGNARHIFAISAWEISGVTGTWASDFEAFHLHAPTASVTGATLASTSFNTGANNELVLLGALGYCATGGATLSSSTGTSDSSHTASGGSTDGFGVFDIAHAYHYVEPTSGTAVAATLTMTVNNNTNIGYGFVELKAPTASTETANVAMSVGAFTQAVAAGVVKTANVAMSVGAFTQAVAAGVVNETANVAMHLGPLTMGVSALNLGVPGAGPVHFSTFGA
jgi:hypothetical protein